MSLVRKSTSAFQFEADPNKIPYADIDFDKYSEFSEKLQESDLRKYIEAEANNFRQDRLEEVSILSAPPVPGRDVIWQ